MIGAWVEPAFLVLLPCNHQLWHPAAGGICERVQVWTGNGRGHNGCGPWTRHGLNSWREEEG
ncbi:MAG: hypothetical protein ACTSUE_21580 [Promethearchaeota archaeon]